MNFSQTEATHSKINNNLRVTPLSARQSVLWVGLGARCFREVHFPKRRTDRHTAELEIQPELGLKY